MAHNIIFIICYSEKKHEERTCVTKDNNQQIGNRIGHRKGKERPSLDSRIHPQIPLCKKEIPHHIKISANV
jgi:hypothetical protein